MLSNRYRKFQENVKKSTDFIKNEKMVAGVRFERTISGFLIQKREKFIFSTHCKDMSPAA